MIVTDKASNNIAALQRFVGVESLVCQIHTLQRAIVTTMKAATIKTKKVSHVLTKCQKLAVKLRKSPKYSNVLKEVCLEKGLKFLKPVAANVTRWNSVFMSLKSLLPLKPALEYLALEDRASDLDWSAVTLEQIEWKIVEATIAVLKMPQAITKLWESDTKPTLHLVIKEIYKLQTNLSNLSQDRDSFVKGFSQILLDELRKRFQDFGAGEKLLAIAHYLDPSTHGVVLEEVDLMESTKQEIQVLANNYDRADQNSGQHPTMELDDEILSETQPDEELDPMEKLLKRRRLERQSSNSNTVRSSSVIAEMKSYEEMPLSNQAILEFWKSNQQQFPLLSQVAREVSLNS